METYNYFVDCGSHHGEGLQEFYDKGLINETFRVICFEPNPYSFKTLTSNKQLLERFKEVELHQEAVWDSDVNKRFRMEHYAPLSKEYDGTGSTLLGEDLWHPGVGVYDRDVYVQAIDFDKFIDNLYSSCPSIPNIIVKMDIEGSEFAVLPKMIQTGSINKLSMLFVEFHDWAIDKEHELKRKQITDDLNALKISWELWK
jgi:FkbM family methyltransferase